MAEHVGDVATESTHDIHKSPILPHYKFGFYRLHTIIAKLAMEKALAKSAVLKARDEAKERSCDPKSKAPPRTPTKENTKPQEFRLHTEQRAVKRAMFNYEVATKLYLMEQQKRQIEKFQKIIEEEEIRLLRKEMIPRAQLMPYFDRPFFPQRSNRPLTVPREPSFRLLNSKRWSCNSGNYLYHFQHAQTWKPIK